MCSFPEARFTVAAARRPEYIVYHTILPMFVITTLVFVGPIGPPEELGGRISMLTTLLLVAIMAAGLRKL